MDAPMPYACISCTQLKIKCDRTTPCNGCRRRGRNCQYHAPAPRKRRRKDAAMDEEGHIPSLVASKVPVSISNVTPSPNVTPSGGGGHLSTTAGEVQAPSPATTISTQASDRSHDDHMTRAQLSRNVAPGNARYIGDSIWESLGESTPAFSKDGTEISESPYASPLSNLVTTAFIGRGIAGLNLLDFHPSREHTIRLWELYVRDIGHIVKMVHIPSTRTLVEQAAADPSRVSNATEALLFAIYHFVLVAITNTECQSTFGEPKPVLQKRYHDAAEQALVNCNFIRTTDIRVLQAYVMFVTTVRNHYDPYLLWVLTGIATRIAQKMGLHRRDAESNLNPFDIQMRRRLWWSIVPLDNLAAQLSGTGCSIVSESWNTPTPLNVNEEDIWPNMMTPLVERTGATDMIFFLARVDICRCLYCKAPSSGSQNNHRPTFPYEKQWKMWNALDPEALNEAITELEQHFEEKYIRFCDYLNPLHGPTVYMMRVAVCYLRLRVRLSRLKGGVLSEVTRQETSELAIKALNYHIASHDDHVLKQHLWHLDGFFQLDPLVWLLHELCSERATLPVETTWDAIRKIYELHSELMTQERGQNVALRRATLKAWHVSAGRLRVGSPEPGFIQSLRNQVYRKEAEPPMPLAEASATGTTNIVMSEPDLSGEGLTDAEFNAMSYTIDSIDWEELFQGFNSTFYAA